MVAKKTYAENVIKVYSDFEYRKKLARYRRAKQRRRKLIIMMIVAISLALTVIGVIISFARNMEVEAEQKTVIDNIGSEPTDLSISKIARNAKVVADKTTDLESVTMYVIEKVNLRSEPNVNSEIKDSLEIGSCVEVTVENEWAYASNLDGYIKAEYLSLDMPECNVYDVSDKATTNFKSYMPYTKITSKTSRQYAIQNTIAYDGLYGIRTVKERFCVAIGTYFNASVGDYADIVLENGTVIHCIISDIKDDKDTDSDNIITEGNGCSTEFIVNIDALNNDAKTSGNISMCNPDWDSRVVKIIVYEANVLEVK